MEENSNLDNSNVDLDEIDLDLDLNLTQEEAQLAETKRLEEVTLQLERQLQENRLLLKKAQERQALKEKTERKMVKIPDFYHLDNSKIKDLAGTYIQFPFVINGPCVVYLYNYNSTIYCFIGEYHDQLTVKEGDDVEELNEYYKKLRLILRSDTGLLSVLLNHFSEWERLGIAADFYLESDILPRKAMPFEKHPTYVTRPQGEGTKHYPVYLLEWIHRAIYKSVLKPATKGLNETQSVRRLRNMNVHYHLADTRAAHRSAFDNLPDAGEYDADDDNDDVDDLRYWTTQVIAGTNADKPGDFFMAGYLKFREIWEHVTDEQYTPYTGKEPDSKRRRPISLRAKSSDIKHSGQFLELVIMITYVDFCFHNAAELLALFIEESPDVENSFDKKFHLFEKWVTGSHYIFYVRTSRDAGKSYPSLEEFWWMTKRTWTYQWITEIAFPYFKTQCSRKKGATSGPKTHHKIAKQISACNPDVQAQIRRFIYKTLSEIVVHYYKDFKSIDWAGRLTAVYLDRTAKTDPEEAARERSEKIPKIFHAISDALLQFSAIPLLLMAALCMDSYLLGRMLYNTKSLQERRSKIVMTYTGAAHTYRYTQFFTEVLQVKPFVSAGSRYNSISYEHEVPYQIKFDSLDTEIMQGLGYTRERDKARAYARFWTFVGNQEESDKDLADLVSESESQTGFIPRSDDISKVTVSMGEKERAIIKKTIESGNFRTKMSYLPLQPTTTTTASREKVGAKNRSGGSCQEAVEGDGCTFFDMSCWQCCENRCIFCCPVCKVAKFCSRTCQALFANNGHDSVCKSLI